MAEASYTLEDLATVGHLKKLAERVHNTYATKAELNAGLATKVDREKLTTELDKALKAKANIVHTHTKTDITDMPTKLSEFENDENFVKQSDLDAKISSVYKPKGSISFSDLAGKNKEENVGNVYNVEDMFTTDATFIEGQSQSYPAGTNVVVVQDDDTEEYKFDVLSGSIDLTGYVQTETLAGYVTTETLGSYVTKDALTEGLKAEFATKADVNHTHAVATSSADGFMSQSDKQKLDGFTVATDEEVFDMLDDVFGLLSRASAMSTSETIADLGDKQVSDLIGDDISIDSEGQVTGTLKKVTEWNEFGGDGTKEYYFPLMLDDTYEGETITVTGDHTTTAADREWVLNVKDANSTFEFKDGETELFTLGFTGATFAEE